MRSIILRNPYYYNDRVKAQAERIAFELSARGAEVLILPNRGVAHISDGGNDCMGRAPYPPSDFVVFLDKDKYAPRFLEKRGIRVFNSAAAIELSDDKMLTHIALSDKGIDMPATIPGLLCYDRAAPLDLEYCRYNAEALGFPLVAKECFGSMGRGVYLARDFDELTEIAERVKLMPHLFQRYIGDGTGRDVRVMVIGGRAVAWMLRKSETDFRSNIELGGKGYKIELEPAFRDMAERAAAILNLDYCGVDLLIGDKGEPLLCEVNSNAFFAELERVTGVNVAGAYAEHIIKIVK